MNHPDQGRSLPSRGLATLACLGAVARLIIIWTGWAEGGLIADDAYYYFKIAANLAAGQGSTFDNLAPTNGYHPLWLWLLVPLFQLGGASLWLPVKLALTASTLLDIGTGVLLWLTLKTLDAERGARAAFLFWFLSPFTLLVGLRGMESSLSAFLVALVIWRLTVMSGRGAVTRSAEALIVGIVLGLAGLARIDNLPVLGAAVAVFALNRTSTGRLKSLSWLSGVAAVSFLVVLPWFWWNLATFGTIFQVSGQVKLAFPIYGALEFDGTSLKGVIRALGEITGAPLIHAARFACLEEFAAARFTLLALLGLAGGFCLAVARARQALTETWRREAVRPVLLACVTFLAGHTLLFGLALRIYANWYALPYLAVFALLVGYLVAQVPWRRRDTAGLVLALAFCLVIFGRFFGGIGLGPARGEREHRAPLLALAEAYPQGVRAGAFNAGLLAHVASGYDGITVVNLDGLVNNEAYAAARDGQLSRYILANVQVLLEPPQNGYFMFRPGELDTLQAHYRKWPSQMLWGPSP